MTERYWGLAGRYWGIIATYAIMQASGLLTAPLLFLTFSITENEAIVYAQLLGFIPGLIVVLFLLRKDMKAPAPANAAPIGNIILWCVAGVFMAYFSNAIAGSIEKSLFGIEEGSENTMMIIDMISITPIFFIVPTIIAPILEEIVFRKIIFGSLYTRFNFFIAAILSAFIFGIVHGEPQHLLIYSGMGLVFAFLYVQTKRIIVPIIVHMTLNTISVVLITSGVLEKLQEKLNNMEALQIILGG